MNVRKIFHEFRGKEPEMLEENLCTKGSTWNYVHRMNQRLWSHCHPFRPSQLVHQQSTPAHFRKEYLCLFGRVTSYAVLHQDSAWSRLHKAAATVQWLENFGQNFIPLRDWLANSPDCSPVDYPVNRIFKSWLRKRKARSVKGPKRAMRQE